MPVASFYHHLQATIGGRSLGWSVIAALGCTYAAALYLAVFVAIRGRGRRRALVTLLIASVALVALTGVRAEREWGEATSLLLGNVAVLDASERARLVAECLSRLLNTLIWIPLLLIPVALLVAFALLWRRQLSWQRGLAAAGALLFAVTAWGICATHWAFIVGFHCDTDCVEEALAQSVDARHWGNVRLVCAGLLCWVGWLVVGRKHWAQQAPSASLLLTSSTLLLSGAVATGAMNGRRHDTEHPLARDPSDRMPCVARAALTRLVPESTSDCVVFDAPAVEILPDGARIDGTPVLGPEGLRDTLDAKRRLWLELNPEQIFPGAVVLVVRRQAAAPELLPWLEAARSAGFTKVGAYVKAQNLVVLSKTLGVLQRKRCCLAPFALDESEGTPLTRFEDWEAVVRATHANALKIALR
jgi:hypothetical protein